MSAPARGVLGWQMAARLATVLILGVSCCCRCCCEGLCVGMERRALLELKDSINYPNGSALPTWGGTQAGDEDCCRWAGVTCNNSTGQVIAVNLPGERTQEQGTWYPNLTMLSHLRKLETLDLSDNQMGGWAFAPALCNLRHLRELHLSNNSLEGIPSPEFYLCLCQMRSLARLYFPENQIQGSFPPCLCNASSLATLSVYSNRLQGKVPPCLGNLHSLEYLMIDRNQFVGGIPPSIFHNLTNLRQVSIGGDHVEGTLHLSVIANLSKLEELYLSSDYGLEIETESSSWVPSFQLQIMAINHCTVNKRSRYGVPRFLSTQHSLTVLGLDGCSLAGRIPPWLFCNSSLLNLILGRNRFHDIFPQPCRNSSSAIEVLVISINKIHGSLPTNIGFLFPFLTHLKMNKNYMEGRVPPSLGQMPLKFLDFSHNNLSGELPLDLTRNAIMLEWIDLSHNHLEGEMLPKDCHMHNLKFLYLSGNNFMGPISPRISNSSLLKVLDVEGNNLRCDLSSCLPLLGDGVSALLLGDNFFEGHLPKHLCSMPHLQLLDISENNLSRKIPTCFNNISSWKTSIQGLSTIETISNVNFLVAVSFTSKYDRRFYKGGPLPLVMGLDLSSNKLHGNIPPELGGLKQLQILNLSYNHLWGSIPTSFSNLLSIESLDLSHNNFSGTIPHELVRLHFLATFSVAFNDLSGAIPFDGQFSSFSVSSYEQNAGLCGPPLEQNCSTNNTEQPGRLEQTEDGEIHGFLDSDKIFYSFLALSYVLGFWCFMATLLLNKRWRVQYFGVIDRINHASISILKPFKNMEEEEEKKKGSCNLCCHVYQPHLITSML